MSDATEGEALGRRVFRLALPAAIGSSVPLIHRVIDSAWVGRTHGHEAVAALGVSTVAVWMFAALGWLVGMGLVSVVGRYVGAGRNDAASYVAAQGLRWALCLGVLAGVAGILLAPLLFRGAGASPTVTAHGIPYARIYWGSGAFVLAQVALEALFRARGDTRTPMLAALVGLVLNAALDPLFIAGVGGWPGWGVAGAAWATLVGTATTVGLLLWTSLRRRWIQTERPADEVMRLGAETLIGQPRRWGLDAAVARRILRVGLPTALASVWFNLVYVFLYDAVEAAGGAAAQAGLFMGHMGEGVAFVVGLGWSAAAASLVGRELGAGRPEAAARAAWTAARQCAGLTAIWAAVLFFAGEPLARFFSEDGGDAAAVAHGAAYMKIVALCLVPQAIELVLDGAFGGAGLTWPPTAIGMALSTARIPLAWWAVEAGHGTSGIWTVIAATAALRGLLVAWAFGRGTWKNRRV